MEPLARPPLGVKSDFDKKSPLLGLTIAIDAIFLPLMFFFLGIRLFVRRREKWLSDDSKKAFHQTMHQAVECTDILTLP
jgi:hypothetical protein